MMSDHKILLTKVILWRAISVSITYGFFLALTGDFSSSGFSTIILHIILMASNYIFEVFWKRYFNKDA